MNRLLLNYYRYLTVLVVLFFVVHQQVLGQSTGSNSSFNFETSVETVTACGTPVAFRIKLTAVVALEGNKLTVTMPSGVEYVPASGGGGLSILSGTGTVSEGTISNLAAPEFTISDLAVGQVLEFTYAVKASCGIIPYVEALNVPSNSYVFTAITPVKTETFQTVGFNVIYGVPSIIDVLTNGVSTAGYAGNIGDVIERKVLIKNGGNGAITSGTYLELDGAYAHSSIVEPYSGGATLTGSRLALSTAAFGGDGIWSPDETIEVTYHETIISCPVGTPSRNIYVGYGCNSDCKVTQTKATQVSTPFLPSLALRVQNNRVTCPGEEAYTATITVVNRGQGTARNFILRALNNAFSTGLHDPWVNLDTAAVVYTLNGSAPIHPFPISTLQLGIPATNRLCNPGVASTVSGLADYNFGDLAPGDSLVLFVSGNSCLTTECRELRPTIFVALASWKQGCSDVQSDFYASNFQYLGGTPGGASVGISDNGVVQITGNNQPIEIGLGYFNYFIQNLANGGYLDICVTIPPGLTFDETQPDSYVIANVNNPAMIWHPASYVRTGNTICYKFSHTNMPGEIFSQGVGAVQKFALSQDCAAGNGVLPLSFTYTLKNSDACTLEHQLACYTRDIVSLCPSPPCEPGGLVLISSDAIRKNYGLPDNDNNARADVSGTIDLSKVSTTQYILGDTMRYTYSGVIAGTSNIVTYPGNDAFNYAYISVGVPTSGTSAFFELLGPAQVIVKKAVGGTVTCTVPGVASTTDFSVLLNGCTELSGYIFQPGDSVWVEQFLRTISTANMANQAVVPTSNYASDVLNPELGDRYGCGVSFGRYRVSGFDSGSSGGNYRVACEGFTYAFNAGILRNNILNGTVGGAYGYGNAFPYEYRNISYPVKFKYLLPAGYTYDATLSKYIHFDVGPGIGFNFPLNEPTMSGDTLIFDISNIYTANGGTLDYPDEGFNVNPVIPFKSICGAPSGVLNLSMTAVQMTSDPEVARLLALAHPTTGTAPYQNIASNSGYYYSYTTISAMYKDPNYLNLTSVSTVSNSEDGTVSYRVRLSNDGTTAMDNTWLYAQNDAIAITQIIDETTNTVYTPNANGFFELGNYTPGYARNYTLKGILSECEDAQDFIYAGSCGAYPTSLANTCSKDTLMLEAHPGETDFQTILTGPNGEVPLCDDADFSFEVKASKLGNVKDVVVNFQLPSGSSIVPGSVYYNYPADAADVLVADPSSLTGTVAFNVSGYSTQLTDVGLRGVGTSDPDSSEVKVSFKVRTDCSFTPGARFRAQYNANDACGNALDPRANTADLAIPGLGALPYRTTVLLITADTAHCAETPTKLLVNITNVVGGTATGTNDSVYVELPPNVSFEAYTPSPNGGDYLNAPTGAPSVYGISSGYTRVAWLLPAGIPSGGSINFPLTYSLDAGLGICDLDSIHAYTGVVSSSSCAIAPGGSCDVLFLNSTVPGKTVPYYQPEISLSYAMNSYCITDPNPVPVLSGCGSSQPGGTFSASPTGLSIDTATGEIDPVGSVAGTYLITYTIPSSGSSCVAASDTMSVTVKGESCPFPVVLVDFKARAVESSVELNWRTVREDESDRFEVEHSVDGKYWSTLGRVAAKGSSNSEVRYNFRDSSPMAGQNVYRLKIVDRDGSYGYSRLESVRFEGNGASSLYPNPVSDKLTLGLTDFGKVSGVELHDLGGRQVYRSGSKPSREISVKNLPSGMCLVSIRYTSGMVRTFKVVVNH